ncbi:MAG: alpha/beta hydrolase [Rubrivivax sp.]|nr:MAG: alpha/beta hydrolase [Rubrivivax sp.]
MTTLVLLPGLDGTGTLFQPLVRELPVTWRKQVIVYPMDAQAGYDALTRLATRALPTEGPLVVLGESFSGPVAIRLAAALGPRLQALVLCCSFARNPRPALASLVGLISWLPAPGALPSGVTAHALIGSSASAESRELLVDALAHLPAAVLRARLRMVMTVDASRELAAVSAPVLYLQAAQDRIVPPAAAADVQRICPRTVVTRLAGPHGLLQASPAPCAAAMTSFLAGLP